MRRALAAGVIAALMILGPAAGIAHAHPTLLFTEPAVQSAVASSPEAITLLFNEPVTIGQGAIVLLGQAGRNVPVGPVSLAQGGRFVTARPGEQLDPGSYTVRWRVTGSDGDQVEQEFRFAVGIALTAGPASSAQDRPAWSEAALRWMPIYLLCWYVDSVAVSRHDPYCLKGTRLCADWPWSSSRRPRRC
jgi:copper transport protein